MMWGRVVELMIAVWVAISPFVFRVADDTTLLWCDSLIALSICVFSGLAFWMPTRHAHLLTLPLSIGLVLWGRFAELPPPPIHQNHIVVGFFLMLMVFVPNDASYPPVGWREEGREYSP